MNDAEIGSLGLSAPLRVDVDPLHRDRLAFTRASDDPRFHLYRTLYAEYEPPPYSSLRDEEIAVVRDWYDEILAMGLTGETGPALIGVMQTFLAVSGLRRVVQLGHYAGYSTLMLGFALRRMGASHALFTADINAKMTDLTAKWVRRAGLSEVVSVHLGDSANPATARAAREYLGGRPQAVLIDSSHQYAHTLLELDQWFEELVPGGLMFLHDVSDFAAQFDVSRRGGVRRALDEWIAGRGIECLRLNHVLPGAEDSRPYIDGCGLAILQKPYRAPDERLREFTAQSAALRNAWPQHDQPPWARITGSMEAMLIGVRITPEANPGDVRIRFAPNDRVRMEMAFYARSGAGPLLAEVCVPGAEADLFAARSPEPMTLAPGMNIVQLDFNWPALPAGRRALTFRLSRPGGDDPVCDVDRGLLVHWLPPSGTNPQTRPEAWRVVPLGACAE